MNYYNLYLLKCIILQKDKEEGWTILEIGVGRGALPYEISFQLSQQSLFM